MALIKVRSLNGSVKLVPESVFNSYLKNKGYVVLSDKKSAQTKEQNVEDDSDNFEPEVDEGEESYEEDVESIPLNEMSGKQLRKYAEIKGIDVSGAKNTREAREIIREWKAENGE